MEQNSARDILVKFNQQLLPVYDILKNLENITLSNDLLEPKIDGEEDETTGVEMQGSGAGIANHVGKKLITVDLGMDQSVEVDKGPKEIPSWMQNNLLGTSTETSNTELSPVKTDSSAMHKTSRAVSSSQKSSSNVVDEEHIKKTLMHHEKETLSHVNMSAVVTHKQRMQQNQQLQQQPPEESESKSNENSDSSDSEAEMNQREAVSNREEAEDEVMSSEEDDDEESQDYVLVKGQQMLFSDISEEHIAQMSAEEREVYVELFQKRVSAFVD